MCAVGLVIASNVQKSCERTLRICAMLSVSLSTKRLPQFKEPAMYPECPLCGSQDCERTTRQMKVWFVCRKCGHNFES